MELSRSGIYRSRAELQVAYASAELALHILEENPRAHCDWTLVLRKHELLKSMAVAGDGIRSLNVRALQL